jgi:hypothetical protein
LELQVEVVLRTLQVQVVLLLLLGLGHRSPLVVGDLLLLQVCWKQGAQKPAQLQRLVLPVLVLVVLLGLVLQQAVLLEPELAVASALLLPVWSQYTPQ